MDKTTVSGKRLFDFSVSVSLLALSSPAVAVISIWIWLDAGKPILFRQRRVGLHGEEFVMLKFRTMVNDAVTIGRKLELSADPYGVIPQDPRITRSGAFLRRTSIDELPQLWNVIRGDMSLVGPRPDIPEQVVNYSSADRARLQVRPGLTGLAQVLGRDEIPWPDRIKLDCDYISRMSLHLDMRILWETLKQVRRPEPEPLFDTWNVEKRRHSSPD